MELTAHPLLADLTEHEREVVTALVEEVVLVPGAVLVEQGGPPTGLHLLLEGHVEVTVEHDTDDHDVAVLGPGATVGELSLLEPAPSSATVTALDEVRAGRVPPAAADQLLAVDAVALQLDPEFATDGDREAIDLHVALDPRRLHIGRVAVELLHQPFCHRRAYRVVIAAKQDRLRKRARHLSRRNAARRSG